VKTAQLLLPQGSGRGLFAFMALILGAILLSGGLYRAEAAPEVLRLTLPEAVALALANNYQVRIADEIIYERQAGIIEAKAANRCQLGLEGRYSRLGPSSSIEIPTPQGSQSVEVGPDKNWQYGASLYKSLYSAGRNQALVQLSRLNVDVAELQAVIVRRQIKLATTKGFLGVIQAQQLIDVAEQTVDSAREHWRISQTRFEAGAAPQFDVLRAEVDIANAEHDLIAAQNGVDLAKTMLKRTLAVDMTTPVQLVAPPEPQIADIAPVACLNLAQQRREEITIAQKAVNMAQVSLRLGRAQRGVNLDLVGGYNRQRPGGFGGTDYGWNVTVSLSKPIFDGGASRAKERQAHYQLQQALLSVEQLKEQVSAEVWQAYLKLEEAKSQLHATEKTVQQAEEASRLAEVRYNAGVGPAVEVTDARVALTAARTNHVNALYGYQIAEAELLSAINVSADNLPVASEQE